MVIEGKFRRTPDCIIPFIHSTATVRAGGPFELYPEANAAMKRQPPGSISQGTVAVLDAQDAWLLVRQGEVEGWIQCYRSSSGS